MRTLIKFVCIAFVVSQNVYAMKIGAMSDQRVTIARLVQVGMSDAAAKYARTLGPKFNSIKDRSKHVGLAEDLLKSGRDDSEINAITLRQLRESDMTADAEKFQHIIDSGAAAASTPGEPGAGPADVPVFDDVARARLASLEDAMTSLLNAPSDAVIGVRVGELETTLNDLANKLPSAVYSQLQSILDELKKQVRVYEANEERKREAREAKAADKREAARLEAKRLEAEKSRLAQEAYVRSKAAEEARLDKERQQSQRKAQILAAQQEKARKDAEALAAQREESARKQAIEALAAKKEIERQENERRLAEEAARQASASVIDRPSAVTPTTPTEIARAIVETFPGAPGQDEMRKKLLRLAEQESVAKQSRPESAAGPSMPAGGPARPNFEIMTPEGLQNYLSQVGRDEQIDRIMFIIDQPELEQKFRDTLEQNFRSQLFAAKNELRSKRKK